MHAEKMQTKEYIAFEEPDTSIHYLQQSGWVCDNQSEQSWHVRTRMNTPNFKSLDLIMLETLSSNKWQAKQIRPLAQQLGYLPSKCSPKEGTMENSPHAKEHLQPTLSFLLHGQINIWCLLLWLQSNSESNQKRLFPGLFLLATLCQQKMVRGSLATLPIGHLRPYPLKTRNTVTCDPTSFYCAHHTKLHLVTCDPTHHY